MLGLKPIKLLPARERVASALRKAIISKSIPEGAELTLENTAQELGVSVTPVREAFQILARDGLLEVKQNKCAIVLGVTEKTIREHYQLRAALEGTACMLCCQNNADLSKIKNCVDTAEEALSHQQAGNYTDYNQSFHFEIWEDYRGKGYGKKFLLAMLSLLYKEGNQVTLQVSGQNFIARKLYKKTGFQTVETLSYYRY